MNTIKSVEEIVKEYREFFLQEIPADEQTPGFVLYCNRCNGGEEFDNWLRNTITQRDQGILNAVVEGLSEMDEQNDITQALLGAMEYRGFYDCGKYLDEDVWNVIKPKIITLVTEILGDKN